MISSLQTIEASHNNHHKLLLKTIAKILGRKFLYRKYQSQKELTLSTLLDAIKQNADSVLSYVNVPLLVYSLKRLDTKSCESRLLYLQNYSVSRYQQLKFVPRLETVTQETLNTLAVSNCSSCRRVYLKDQSISQIIKSQQNRPIFIISLKELYLEQLQKMLCVAGNNGNSYILIALKYKPEHTLQGFQSITKEDFKKLATLCQDAQAAILPKNHLKIKVGLVEVTTLGDLVKGQNQKLKKFLIKISVNSRPQKQKVFFHLEYKLTNFRSTYHYFKAEVNKEGIPSIKKMQGTQIYEQIVKVASSKQKHENIFEDCSFYDNQQSSILIDVFDLIKQDIEKQDTTQICTKQYVFPDDSSDLLLSCCKIFYNQKFDDQFRETIKQNQSVTMIQISDNENSNQILKTLTKSLNSANIKWRYFKPMPNFQKSFNDFRLQQFPGMKTFSMYFFIFEGEYDIFMKTIKETFKYDYHQKLLIQKITQKMSIGLSITQIELQHLQSLMFHKFVEMPTIKKSKINGLSQVSYRQVEFAFRKQDLNIAMYAYALLIFCKKRPMSIE